MFSIAKFTPIDSAKTILYNRMLSNNSNRSENSTSSDMTVVPPSAPPSSLTEEFSSYFQIPWESAECNLVPRMQSITKNIDRICMILTQCPTLNVSMSENCALNAACAIGNMTLLTHLLNHPNLDLTNIPNAAVLEAAVNGNAQILFLLLKDVRFHPEDDVLAYAAAAGQMETVRLLLRDGRVDPTNDNCKALLWASESGDEAVEEMIYRDERVQRAIENFMEQ
jgi:hypothetical protein